MVLSPSIADMIVPHKGVVDSFNLHDSISYIDKISYSHCKTLQMSDMEKNICF